MTVRARKEPTMTRPMSRRNALGAFSTIGLGTLLAACTRDGDPTSAASDGSATGGASDTTSATVDTVEGGTATVSPQATGSLTAASFAAVGSCTLTRELTEGPYYFDVDAIRSDIREDSEGTVLRIGMLVQDSDTCAPIPNAVADIWHCDAGGSYSGFESASRGSGGGGRGGPTDEETYLRGAQVTNSEGIAEFTTVYPGWYAGRTVHIHCKVHLDKTTLLTTQLFFDDELSQRVFTAAPYASHTGRVPTNDEDGIFDDSLVLTTAADADGYLGLITVNVDPA